MRVCSFRAYLFWKSGEPSTAAIAACGVSLSNNAFLNSGDGSDVRISSGFSGQLNCRPGTLLFASVVPRFIRPRRLAEFFHSSLLLEYPVGSILRYKG